MAPARRAGECDRSATGECQRRTDAAGYRGPAFLVFDNFRAILKYNNSTSYALAVGLLGDTARPWTDQSQLATGTRRKALSRSQRIELQEGLARKGFNPGPADGIIGANTRKAIRAYQTTLGWPADGYPTEKLLQRSY